MTNSKALQILLLLLSAASFGIVIGPGACTSHKSEPCPPLDKQMDMTNTILEVYKMGFEDGKKSGQMATDSIIYIKLRKQNKNTLWK